MTPTIWEYSDHHIFIGELGCMHRQDTTDIVLTTNLPMFM